jgi:hypothetical protein
LNDAGSHFLESEVSSLKFNEKAFGKIKKLINDKQVLKKDLNDVRKILLMKPDEFNKHEYLTYRIKKLSDMWPSMQKNVYPKFKRDNKGQYVLLQNITNQAERQKVRFEYSDEMRGRSVPNLTNVDYSYG